MDTRLQQLSTQGSNDELLPKTDKCRKFADLVLSPDNRLKVSLFSSFRHDLTDACTSEFMNSYA